ncbi:MAG: orotate phosphoribosyltransferase [Myxococcota bacterium]
MSSASLKIRLRDLLAKLSLRRGRVVLASGKESDFYLDCKQTTLNAEGASVVGELVFEHIRRLRADGLAVEGVGGMTLGADPIAVATAVTSHKRGEPLHAFIIRKEPKSHGTRAYLEGAKNLGEGARVLLVEDVVTTGGSTLRALERARESGLEPVAILTLVDRQEGGRENLEATGLPFAALLTRADFDEVEA